MKPFVKNQKVETSLIESYIYPKFGPGQYWETMAEEIQKLGGEVILNAEVSNIATFKEYGKQIIKSVSYKQNGEEKTIKGDYFIWGISEKEFCFASSTGLVQTKDMAKVGIVIGTIGFVLGFFWLTKIFPFATV